MSTPARVTLLTQEHCSLCEHAKQVLERVAVDHPLTTEEISLDTPEGRRLAERAGVLFAPGLLLDGEPFGFGRVSEKRLRKALAQRPVGR